METNVANEGSESDSCSYFSSDEDIEGNIGTEEEGQTKTDDIVYTQKREETPKPLTEEEKAKQKILEQSGCPLPKTNKTFLVNTLVSTLRHPIKSKDHKRKDWKSYSDDGSSKHSSKDEKHKKHDESQEGFNPDYEHYVEYYDEQMNYFMYGNHYFRGPGHFFDRGRGFNPGRWFDRGRGFVDRGRGFERGRWFDRGYTRGRGRGQGPQCYTQSGDYDEGYKFDSEFDAYAYREDGKGKKEPVKESGESKGDAATADIGKVDGDVEKGDKVSEVNDEHSGETSVGVDERADSPVKIADIEATTGIKAEPSDNADDCKEDESGDVEKHDKAEVNGNKEPDEKVEQDATVIDNSQKSVTQTRTNNQADDNQNMRQNYSNNSSYQGDQSFHHGDGNFDPIYPPNSRFFNRGWRPRYRGFRRPPFYPRGPRPYWHPNMYLKNFHDVPRQSIRCEGGILYRNGLYFVPRDSDSDRSDDDDDRRRRRKKLLKRKRSNSSQEEKDDALENVDVMKYGDFESYYKAVMSAKKKKKHKKQHKKHKHKKQRYQSSSEDEDSEQSEYDKRKNSSKIHKNDKTQSRDNSGESGSARSRSRSEGEEPEEGMAESEASRSEGEIRSGEESGELRSKSHSSGRQSRSRSKSRSDSDRSRSRRKRKSKHRSSRRSYTESSDSYSDDDRSDSPHSDDSEYSRSESESRSRHRSSRHRKRGHESSDSRSDSDSKHKHHKHRRKSKKHRSHKSKHKSKHSH